MVLLNELSPIGFGCYRITARDPRHVEALSLALSAGCNLIDTAANYMGGESEQVVGEVLAGRPAGEAFVISKCGYAGGEDLSGVPEGEVVGRNKDSLHSIHPVFLDRILSRSRQRTRRDCLDGYLLHNPERFFEQKDAAVPEYYRRLQCAFERLESWVQAGAIRYYGISSNTLPAGPDAPGGTDLRRLVEIAASITPTHHFRLIQFPMNWLERDATLPHYSGESLLGVARRFGITTIINRPLNALSEGRLVRLAEYEGATCDGVESAWTRCVATIQRQLDRLGGTDKAEEFEIVQTLGRVGPNLDSTDMMAAVRRDFWAPFIATLYQDEPPPPEDQAGYEAWWAAVESCCRWRMTRNARQTLRSAVAMETVDADDSLPTAVAACKSYLDWGAAHVLVGMRTPAYVRQMMPLFGRRPG